MRIGVSVPGPAPLNRPHTDRSHGFSKAGEAALYASLTRFLRLHAPLGWVAAYIAFYTPCWITFRDDEEVSDGPIRLLHGTADDWTPIEPCQEDGTRLRR